MSAPANGRPTQFHAVPLEERAVDSQGRTLPWALEWHEDHPNARHQKRQPEEKGPFGKSLGRKGSQRGIRGTTPAKKENPILEGFELALKHDRQKAAEEVNLRSDVASTRAQNDGTSSQYPSVIKQPTQVILYGYSPSTQWAAISFYEKVSEGMICEDYERDPPYERRKYQNHLSAAIIVRPRALTKEESILARQYRGGDCWIKVTFDSAEAAERAIYNSPHLLQRYWVYAQLFHGTGPEFDEPIPVQEEDRPQDLLGAPKPTQRRVSQTLGPSFSRQNSISSRGPISATLPRSFTGATMTQQQQQQQQQQADEQLLPEILSQSSSTVSSATATAPAEYPDLRNRLPTQIPPSDQEQVPASSDTNSQPPTIRNPNFFTHFPDVPKTTLRPAHEAFLPHPTWIESTITRLSNAGWLPGGMIGDGIPRLENGEFDWAKASVYWKIFYLIDCTFGSDFCGLKDD